MLAMEIISNKRRTRREWKKIDGQSIKKEDRPSADRWNGWHEGSYHVEYEDRKEDQWRRIEATWFHRGERLKF